ncbi:MAG TPA: DUF1552 domain-containing protein [Verrucomicrobiae bacterium]|jgi:hypothetical protein
MKTNASSTKSAAANYSSGVSRRHFLRGLGACLALPAFGSLTPLKLLAAEAALPGKLGVTATGAPLRAAFLSFPNGAIPNAWWPDGEGADFKLSSTLQPLEPHRKLIQVLGGLDHACANPGADGAGDHARGSSVFLTGVRLKKSPTDIHAGISIDQVMAKHIGHLTRFPSLELSRDNNRKATVCDSNYSCAYVYNISWSSPTTPMTPESNPRLLFERLFGSGAHGERIANERRRQQEQSSILDFVMDDARRMQKRLGGNDKDKLDQYLTDIRDIETRIQRTEHLGKRVDPEMDTPEGVPSDQAEYVQIMYDLLLLAFQTDSTRVATFCLAHDGDNRSFSNIGIPEGHHDLSHHKGNPEWIAKVARIDLWYAQQFARFLQKLNDTKDVDGNSLLQNSMIVYGSGNADGNRHSHTNLPLILAGGGGGGLTPGRYTKFNGKPATNLFLSMADRMGIQGLERFGDSTGRLGNV